MSCYWHLRCVDCSDTHHFDSANHRPEKMRLLAMHADALAALAELERQLGCYPLVSINLGESVDLEWFAKHRGHELVPVDEYGCDDTYCHETYADASGQDRVCGRWANHDGDHMPQGVCPTCLGKGGRWIGDVCIRCKAANGDGHGD